MAVGLWQFVAQGHVVVAHAEYNVELSTLSIGHGIARLVGDIAVIARLDTVLVIDLVDFRLFDIFD